MKKRTKSKSRNKDLRLQNDLLLPFCLSVFICLLCALLCYYFFHTNFFRALSKIGEEPIATITFKYKTAERKFLDRVVWDRLRQNSPVYNGDTIHTAERSEATVWFDDGTALNLAESTMAQVFLHADGILGAELEKGAATVDSAEGAKGFSLRSHNTSIQVKGGSRLSAQKTEGQDNLLVTVQKGSASLDDGSSLAEGTSFSVSESGEKAEALSVLSPLPFQKILCFEEGDCPVEFRWNYGEEKNLQLLIASDKDFTSRAEKIDVSGMKQISLSLSKGTHYWKIFDGGGNERSGKVQVIQSLPPVLLAPAEGYSYQYRKKTPAVRFIWTESEAATAYSFELSKNQSMKNPLISERTASSSIIISTLEEGTYYYRVTPYYAVNRTGLSNPSETRSFTIKRSGSLLPVSLVAPSNGAFVDKSKNTFTLSWRMESEAAKYTLLLSRNKNLSQPLLTRTTAENYAGFAKDEVSTLPEGEYFWAVTQTDGEGNESAASEIRSFYLTDGKIEQRTVFPPDGYTLWKPLCVDTSFTWKTNLSLTQYIQVARDADFSEIVFDSEADGNSLSGINLEAGEYYWRLTAKDENFKRATSAKKLTVVEESAAPVLLEPNAAKRAVSRPNEDCEFKWKESEGADYYRIKIYGKDGRLIADENFISGNSFLLNMEAFEEGEYRWELQSFSYETTAASRRSSTLSSSRFILRKIRPVIMIQPLDKCEIDGWDAIENPPYFEWKSFEAVSESEIILSKKGAGGAETQTFGRTGYKTRLPQLSSGTYEWTVKARTMDDLDISAVKTFSFTVLPIPPFEKPLDAHTAGGTLFNAGYLRKTPFIEFEWRSVHRAGEYIIEIYDDKKRRLVREILAGNESTKFKLENLSDLGKGHFTWSIRAVMMDDEKKEILIDGEAAEGDFTIDYTMNASGGKREKKGELYAE